MASLWDWIKTSYVRVIEPFIGFLVRRQVTPNTLTTIGTLCSCSAGVVFATGHIRTAGWLLAITAIFDIADGIVARRTNQSSIFGAFYDSTLDRIADGFLLGGLTFFFASSALHRSLAMVAVGLVGMIATFIISYTRSRAEALGIDMRGVGMMERAERIVLLAVPQAFFGLALDGLVLRLIFSLLAATAIVTAVQRISHVRSATQPAAPPPTPAANEPQVGSPTTPSRALVE